MEFKQWTDYAREELDKEEITKAQNFFKSMFAVEYQTNSRAAMNWYQGRKGYRIRKCGRESWWIEKVK